MKKGFLVSAFMFVLIAVFAMPTFAQNQGRGRGRGKPSGVFVNGHDARDGRTDKNRRNNRSLRDLNGDGRIDETDRRIANGDWRNNRSLRDLNGDGRIDETDWRIANGQQNDDWRYRNNGDWRNGDWRNGRTSDGYPNYGGTHDLRQTALNAGFNEGVREGRRDRQRGEAFEFRDESGYQRATSDYSSRLGDRSLYMTYYRQAFENGYRDGYAGY